MISRAKPAIFQQTKCWVSERNEDEMKSDRFSVKYLIPITLRSNVLVKIVHSKQLLQNSFVFKHALSSHFNYSKYFACFMTTW